MIGVSLGDVSAEVKNTRRRERVQREGRKHEMCLYVEAHLIQKRTSLCYYYRCTSQNHSFPVRHTLYSQVHPEPGSSVNQGKFALFILFQSVNLGICSAAQKLASDSYRRETCQWTIRVFRSRVGKIRSVKYSLILYCWMYVIPYTAVKTTHTAIRKSHDSMDGMWMVPEPQEQNSSWAEWLSVWEMLQ